MALRKEEIKDAYDKEKRVMKERTRITIDVSPELRKRIKVAAAENGVSISEYLGRILEESVPARAAESTEGHPVTLEAVERLRRLREKIFRENNEQYFEDSSELLYQQREERTRQLMGELEE
jgi:hypothetical protein